MKAYFKGLILLCVSSLVACSPKGIQIGVVLPLSGQAAPRGEDMLNAAVLAVEERNQAGGIQGKQITLQFEDDRDDPEKALLVADHLVKSKVLAVIGHYSSSATQMTLPTYAAADIALVSPAVALTHIPGEGQNFFRTLNANYKQASEASRWIRKAGYQHVAVVHNPSIYGRDLAQQMLIELRQPPLADVPRRITVFEDDGSASRLEGLQKDVPELVFYAGGYKSAAHFLNALFALGIDVDWMGGRPLWEHDFARLLGSEQAQHGWVVANAQTEDAEQFYTRYSQRFGRPGPFSYSTYLALQNTFKGLEKAPKNMTRKQVREALRQHFLKFKPPALSVFSLNDEDTFVPAEMSDPLAPQAGNTLGALLAKGLQPKIEMRPKASLVPAKTPTAQAQ